MRYLLDTNVLSETRKPRGDEGLKAWISAVPADDLFVTRNTADVERTGVALLDPFSGRTL